MDCYAHHSAGVSIVDETSRRVTVAAYRAEAGVSLFARPIAWVHALGFGADPCATRVCGCASDSPSIVAWKYHRDPRMDGGRLFYQFAYALMARAGMHDNEAGIWRFAEELAFPFATAGIVTSLAHAYELQPYAPRVMIATAYERLTRTTTVCPSGLRVAR